MFVNCLQPRFITNPYTHEKMCVPCGKCSACLSSRQSKWVTRLNLEAENWPYVVFFTLTFDESHLPKIDLSEYCADDTIDNSKLLAAIDQCPTFCKVRDYQIPYFPVDLLQKFIKRLRKWLYTHEEERQNTILRYFISTEYGPTTFRPHCHGLLFFRSKRFATCAQERIYKAWSDYNPNSSTFSSYGRIDVQFVSSDAANYVAGYVSFISNLPAVLQCKPFRPYKVCSTCPPIGTQTFTDAQIQKIFHRGLTTFSYEQPSTHEVVTLPLWRTYKDKLFPKIKNFNRFSFDERIALYRLGYDWQDLKLNDIVRLVRLHFYDSYIENLLQSLFGDFWPLTSLNDPFYTESDLRIINQCQKPITDSLDYDAFYRFVCVVKRVCVLTAYFNVTIETYVQKISDFYSNTDYECLKRQLQCECDYMNHVPSYPLKYLPYLIDPAFGDNSRNLSVDVYRHYREHFGLSEIENLDIKDTEQYKEVFARCTEFYENSHKTRQKNEYIDAHPYIKKFSYTN